MVVKIENGDIPTGTIWMDNWNNNYRINGLNTIRTLQDRAITLAPDGGEFAEAYTDSTGRLNSVASATAEFYTDKYTPTLTDQASGDSTADPNSYTNPSYAFDSDDATAATKASPAGADNHSLGKTFSAKTVDWARVRIKMTSGSGDGSQVMTQKLQSYNGSTWSDVATIYARTGAAQDTGVITQLISVNASIQGIRILCTLTGGGSANAVFYIYSLEYGDAIDGEITHTIPANTFSSTLSTAFGTFLPEDWEAGADVQFKLTNATEDTGYLATNQVVEFTALTSEPTSCIVKLIPKTSSPTAGYPSINGFALYGDKP
jgi:hypothetical protein